MRGKCARYLFFLIFPLILTFSPWEKGTAWAVDFFPQTVDSNGSVGEYTSIALDSSGNPHISYNRDSFPDNIKYAKWTGASWNIQTVDPGGGWDISIALDSSNNPHISYGVKYAKWTGASWNIQTVDSSGIIGRYSSIALDSSNNPHISYYDQTNNALKYAKWTGASWNIQTVDSGGGGYSSIALDSSGNPHISYSWGSSNPDTKYAKWTGASWNIQTVESAGATGGYSSIALDSSGNPHISYYDWSNNDLKYARWTGSSWNIQTVDSGGNVGKYTSIALDSSNNPHISYYDETNLDLKYARWTGSSWNIQTVDSGGNVGQYSSIALDSSGNSHISYYDFTNTDLKYAKGIPQPPPAAPANLAANLPVDMSATKLALSWTDMATNETGFRLERSIDDITYVLANGTPNADNIPPDTLTYTSTNLSPNTTYWHQINAFNVEGSSTWSNSSPLATRASVPGTGSTPEIYITSVTVNWLNNATNPNPSGTTYVVERATSSNFGGTKTAPDELGNYTATYQSLTPNTTYWFRVKAVNHGGVETAPNTYWLSVTLVSKPGSVGLSATAPDSVTASWFNDTPVNPDGTNYVCEISTDVFATLVKSTTTKNFSYTFNNLIQNSAYYVQVKAVNHAGVSSGYRYLGSIITPASQPSGLLFSNIYESSVTLQWTGGLGCNGYRLEASRNSSFSPLSAVSLTSGTNGPVPGLVKNTSYYFQVGCLNVDNVATWAMVNRSTATRASMPGPGNITGRGGIDVTANWDSNANPIGTTYILEASTDSLFNPLTSSAIIAGLSDPVTGTVGGLSSDTLYYLQVKASNLYGIDTAYRALGSTITLSQPPENVDFSGVWNSSATVSWDTMLASGYELRWSIDPNFGTWSSTDTAVVNATSLTATTGLDINTTYYFRAGSRNAIGETSFAETLSTATLANAPVAAVIPLTGVGPTTITANWTANGNPSPQTTYQVQASTTDLFSVFVSTLTSALTYPFTGLTSQATYYLQVRAINHSGIPTGWIPLGSTATVVTITVSSGSFVAPGTVLQNNEVALLRLSMSTDSGSVNWKSIALKQIGMADNTADIEAVRIYLDNQSSLGTFDPLGSVNPNDIPVYAASVNFDGSGNVTVNIRSDEPPVSTGVRNYFVVCKIAGAASVGKTVKVEVANGALSFSDGSNPGIWQIQSAFPIRSGESVIQDSASTVRFQATTLSPASIPRGTADVAIFKIKAWTNEVGTANLTRFDLTRTGSALGAVTAIKIYRSADDALDGGDPQIYLDSDGFSTQPEPVILATPETITQFPVNYFVTMNISPAAMPDTTLGTVIYSTDVYFSGGTDTVQAGDFPVGATSLMTITDIPNTLTVAFNNEAPSTTSQGSVAPMLKLSMNTDVETVRWTGLRVDLSPGEQPGDVSKVELYWNGGGAGFSESEDVIIASTSFQSDGRAYLTISSTQNITQTEPRSYYLVYRIAPDAGINGNRVTANVWNASYLTVTTLNTTISAATFPGNSGAVTIQPTVDQVTATRLDPQPAPPNVTQGDANVAMAKFRLSVNANAAIFTGVKLDKQGGCRDEDVNAIKIWRDVSDPSPDEQITSIWTFREGLANVTLDNPQTITAGTQRDYFVTFSFTSNASAPATCGLSIASTAYFTLAIPDTMAQVGFSIQAQTTVNEYADTIYITTTSIAPVRADPGTLNVPVLKLGLRTGYAAAPWKSLTLARQGGAESSDFGPVKIWLDRNGDGQLNTSETVDGPYISSASFPSGGSQTTLSINPNQIIELSPKTYFLTVDLNAGAKPNRQFGFSAFNNYFVTQIPDSIANPGSWFMSDYVAINEPPSKMMAGLISAGSRSQVTQDEQNVPFMTFSLRTDRYNAYWNTLKLERFGDGADQDISYVTLYPGSNASGTPVLKLKNPFVNKRTTLSFGDIEISTVPKTFTIALDISPVAKVDGSVGVRIGGSSSLMVNAPDFTDPNTAVFDSVPAQIQSTQDLLQVTIEPIPTTLKQGDSNKALTKITLSADNHAVAWEGLRVMKLGSLAGAGVAAISVWRDSGNGELDEGTDSQAGSFQQPFTEESGVATLSLNAPETITASPQLYFLAVSLNRTATVGETVGLSLGDSGSFVVTEPDTVSTLSWESDLFAVGDYPDVLTVKPSSIEVEGIYQGQEQALGMADLSLNEDTAGLLVLKIKKTGTLSETQITGVRVYLDSDGNKQWNKNADKLLAGPVAITNGYANLAFAPAFSLLQTTATVFLTYAMATNAAVNYKVGWSIEKSSDVYLEGVDTVSTANLPFTIPPVIVKDARVPTKPLVYVEHGQYTNRPTQMHFDWDSTVFSGSIVDAEYAIGTSTTTTDVRGWTSIGNNKEVLITDLALEHGKTYHMRVRVKSNTGFYSDIGNCFYGVTVDTMKPVVTQAPQVMVDNDKVMISWGSASVGPSGIVGYKIEERNAIKSVWSVITPVPSATAPGAVPASLIAGNSYFVGAKPSGTYYYRVRAVNGAGMEGEPSPATRVVVGPVSDMAISNAFCYPNPFDARRINVNIVYALNQDTDTEIKIYELFGNKVWSKTFGQGEEGGRLGVNTIVWDGTDYNGEKVSFGVHLCEIKPKNGGEAEVKIAVIH